MVWFGVPESISWLCRKQPAGALEKVNATFKRMGYATIEALPPLPPPAQRPSFKDLFKPRLLRLTLLMVVAYFAHITSFYYIIKWVAPIASDMGYSGPVVADVLLWISVGGAAGGALLGLLALRWNVRLLTVGILVLSTIAISIFGTGSETLVELKTIIFFCGFFVNGGIVGLYTLLAIAFPTHLRATGTGIVIGAGRGGAALAPIIAGYLFQHGMGLQSVSIIMGFGALIGAVALLFVRYQSTSEAVPDAARRQLPGPDDREGAMNRTTGIVAATIVLASIGSAPVLGR